MCESSAKRSKSSRIDVENPVLPHCTRCAMGNTVENGKLVDARSHHLALDKCRMYRNFRRFSTTPRSLLLLLVSSIHIKEVVPYPLGSPHASRKVRKIRSTRNQLLDPLQHDPPYDLLMTHCTTEET